MGLVLLLGAGFSRNWGGWLADEVNADLLGRLAEDVDLNLILRHSESYESALSQIQNEFRRDADTNRPRLEKLQEAIRGTFQEMNHAFSNMTSFEFSNSATLSIRKFLAHFDAIFTLNQDLLLELQYNSVELQPRRRWNGYYFPGMQPPANWRNIPPSDLLEATWRPMATYSSEAKLQPIFKLHGSVNWRDVGTDSSKMLVMGGDKEDAINQVPILARYRDEFRKYLEQPHTRLMVIGYSFGDLHINKILVNAWEQSGLKMFIVDPLGLDPLNTNSWANDGLSVRLPEIPIIGLSRRSLRETFGGDMLEYSKFARFIS